MAINRLLVKSSLCLGLACGAVHLRLSMRHRWFGLSLQWCPLRDHPSVYIGPFSVWPDRTRPIDCQLFANDDTFYLLFYPVSHLTNRINLISIINSATSHAELFQAYEFDISAKQWQPRRLPSPAHCCTSRRANDLCFLWWWVDASYAISTNHCLSYRRSLFH